MYKEIKIVYTDSLKEEIIQIFTDLGIEKYINLEGLQSTWSKTFKHLNNKIWPGTESMMFTVLKTEDSLGLIEKLRVLKQELKDGVALFVLVSPIDEII